MPTARTNTHVDGIVLSSNISHRSNSPIDRRMEPMIVLWRQPKDQERTAIIPLSLALVRIPQQPSDSELAALDPQPRSLVDRLKRHETAVRRTDESFGVFRLLNGSSIGLELPVEELVERLCKGRSVLFLLVA